MSTKVSGDLSPRSLMNAHVQSSAEEQDPVLVASRQALEVPRESSDAKWEERDVTVETRRLDLGASSASFAAGEKEFAAMKGQIERDMAEILEASELSQDDRQLVLEAIRETENKQDLTETIVLTESILGSTQKISLLNKAMAEMENDTNRVLARMRADLKKQDSDSDRAPNIAVGLLKLFLFVTTGIPSA